MAKSRSGRTNKPNAAEESRRTRNPAAGRTRQSRRSEEPAASLPLEIEAPRRSRRISHELEEPKLAVQPVQRRPAPGTQPDAERKKKRKASTPNQEVDALLEQAGEKTKTRRSRALGAVFLVLLLVGALGFLGYKFVRADEIEVRGNVKMESAYVAELSGIASGTHMLQINKQTVRERIESDPHFIYVGVEYHFPSKITIVVEERPEAACFTFVNTFVITDAEGLILGHTEGPQPDLPLIEGMEITEFVLGAKVRTDDTYKGSVMTQVLGQLKTYALTDRFSVIRLSDVNDIVLQMKDGTSVRLGQALSLDEKFEWLVNILDVLKEKGMSGGVIDITSIEMPAYVPAQTEGEAQN